MLDLGQLFVLKITIYKFSALNWSELICTYGNDFTFFEGPQYNCKFCVCIMLSCEQKNCCIFVDIELTHFIACFWFYFHFNDSYIFNHFSVMFHIFLWTDTYQMIVAFRPDKTSWIQVIKWAKKQIQKVIIFVANQSVAIQAEKE